MKTLLVTIFLTFVALTIEAQTNRNTTKSKIVAVPSELVQKAFTSKFPNASNVKWGFEKKGNYEADFSQNNHEMTAIINKKGILLETDTEIKESELPQNIKTILAKNFAGYKIDEIDKIETKNIITYEMKAINKKFEFDLIIANNGKILKKEKYIIDNE